MRAASIAKTYKAFISYSHGADGRLAPRLQSGLHRFAKPFYKLRAMRVFRDETDLSATPALWPMIQRALDEAEYFVVLASPDAARSKWVKREISHWLKTHDFSTDKLLIVVTDGKVAWNNSQSDFDWTQTNALPELLNWDPSAENCLTLRGMFSEEPLYVDLSWARSATDLSLANPQFLDSVASIAATLHAKPKSEMIGEDIQSHRRFRIIRNIVVLALLLLSISASLAAYRAVVERDNAHRQLVGTNVSVGNQFVDRGNLLGALPWFAETVAIDQGRTDRESLHRIRFQAVLSQCPRPKHVLFHDGDVSSANANTKGTLVVTSSWRDSTRLWNVQDGSSRRIGTDGQSDWAAFSDDGKSVLIRELRKSAPSPFQGGDFHTLQLWDTQSGQSLSSTFEHGGAVSSSTLSQDGNLIATGGYDGKAKVWEVSGGQVKEFNCTASVNRVQFDKSGKHLLTVSTDKKIRIWDLESNAERVLAENQPDNQAVFSATDSLVLGTSGTVWNLKTGTSLGLDGLRVCNHITISHDERWIATCHGDYPINGDGWARIWSAETGKPTSPMLLHGEDVIDADFNKDGSILATASRDHTVALWQVPTGTRIGPPLIHGGDVETVQFIGDGRYLLSAGRDGTARIWDVSDKQSTVLRSTGSLAHAAISADGKRIAAAGFDPVFSVWDTASHPPSRLELRHANPISKVRFSTDSKNIIGCESSGYFWAWSLVSPQKAPLGPGIAADGNFLLVSHVQALDVDDLITGNNVTLVNSQNVFPAALNSMYGVAAGLVNESYIRFWDIASGKVIRNIHWPALAERFKAERDTPREMKLSPDGQRALLHGYHYLVVGFNGTEKPFEHRHTRSAQFHPNTGELVIVDHDGRVTVVQPHSMASRSIDDMVSVKNLVFSSTGERLLTVHQSNIARIWDTATFRSTSRPMHHGGAITSAQFSPDEKLVLTCSEDKSARVWDASTGEAVTPPLRSDFSVAYAEFRSDGMAVLTASSDSTVRMWPLHPAQGKSQELVAAARFMSAQRLDELGGQIPLEPIELESAWQSSKQLLSD